jgi:hypothetical protein
MAEPTPRPWAVENPMEFELSIVEANKQAYEWRFIAHVTLPEAGRDNDGFTIDECEANARLIVEAVNSFDRLAADRERLVATARFALAAMQGFDGVPFARLIEASNQLASVIAEIEEAPDA